MRSGRAEGREGAKRTKLMDKKWREQGRGRAIKVVEEKRRSSE